MQVWCGSEMPEETYGDCKSLLLLFCFSSCLRLVTPVHCLLRRSESAIAVRSLFPIVAFYLATAERIHRDKEIKDIPLKSI